MAFLLSIGFQLKAAHGDELFPSSVAIDVDQTLHELDEGGLLTGVRVERLYALPWATVNIRVRQHVVRAGGEVAGVTIAELIDEVHRIPLPVFREMALLGPLRRLRLRKPDARVVLVVDALDEEGAGADGIGSVLPLADELAAIGNLTDRGRVPSRAGIAALRRFRLAPRRPGRREVRRRPPRLRGRLRRPRTGRRWGAGGHRGRWHRRRRAGDDARGSWR